MLTKNLAITYLGNCDGIDFGAKFDIPTKCFSRSEEGTIGSRISIGRFEHSEEYLKELRPTQEPGQHCGPTGKKGVIVWIKPGIVGNEQSDVLQYFREHPTFPQQTTAIERQINCVRFFTTHVPANLRELRRK